jgi:hypothetical protein
MNEEIFGEQSALDQNSVELLDRSLAGQSAPLRGKLQALLDLASALKRLPQPEIDQDHFLTTLLKLGAKIHRSQRPSIFHSIWLRAAAGILLFLTLGLSTSLFSQKSNPGDPLYPIKLLTEKVRFFFTFDRAGQVELRLTFAEHRSQEFVKDLEKNNKVNKQLLESMLLEAKAALEHSTELPESQQQPLMIRAESLNRYQLGLLEKAKTRVPDDSLVLEQALCTCRQRMDQLHKTLCPKVPECPMNNCPMPKGGG